MLLVAVTHIWEGSCKAGKHLVVFLKLMGMNGVGVMRRLDGYREKVRLFGRS
jgi:hypothetical protein